MRIAVVTVSDRSYNGFRADITGPELIAFISSNTKDIAEYHLISDDRDMITAKLIELSDAGVELVLTCGGTGFAERDNTPEATRSVIDKEAPGIMEYIRYKNYANNPNSYYSRGVAGIRGKTIIINLPGSPGGAKDSYQIIMDYIRHPVDLAGGFIRDCKKA